MTRRDIARTRTTLEYDIHNYTETLKEPAMRNETHDWARRTIRQARVQAYLKLRAMRSA